MNNKNGITNWLNNTNGFFFSFYLIAASFITYFSMYAFRKPLSAGVFEGLELWGIDYKIIALFSQLLGYTFSKFLGIKVIAELKASTRIIGILGLIAIAWMALFFFAVVPVPYNLFFLFLNGLPLGMIWGVVFSFLEGRKLTEILGAGLSSSFIVSSGVVKAAGRTIVVEYGSTEFWMPFLTGLLFIPALLVGVYMLSKIPPPKDEDEAQRTKRVPMNNRMKKEFFLNFAVGIVLSTVIYIFLTIFRDVRDNFAVEIWANLGFAERPDILATAEIPIAFGVLVIVGMMSVIKNNRSAFFTNNVIIVTAGILLIVTTMMYQDGLISPVYWMILNGFSMYLAYIAYHTFLFERWIALFRIESNIGFLMYIADAFGYLGSIVVIFSKDFISLELNWLEFFIEISFITGIGTLVLGVMMSVYFIYKDKKLNNQNNIRTNIERLYETN